jgi:copper chaperone NosL
LKVKGVLEKANELFEVNLDLRSRILVLVAALLLIPTFIFPLWTMTLYSNQFPDGLQLYIYSFKLEGGKSPARDDLREINALNHYIGMRELREEDFTEFKWIPFAIGGMILLALRTIVLGKVSKLVDLFVLFTYFGLFSLWSFYHKLNLYGHDLAPTAAVKVPPFTPPLFGHETLANFDVYSFPGVGSYFMAVVPIVFALALWLTKKSAEQRSPLFST